MDIFVYGTLKNGFSNHHIIRDSVFIGKDTTSDQYCMFDLGSFPAVVDTDNCCNIMGEVYFIDRDILNSLDILEGKFFTRKKVKLESNREVWMYFLDASACNTSKFPLIPDGVWNK